MLQRRDGFTLIELLIVVVIIGVLAAIAVPKFANTKGKAYYTAMKSDLRNMVTAEESFFYDSSKYSTDINALNMRMTTGVNAPTITTGPGYWTATVSHSQLAGHICGISINTTNPIVATVADGTTACN
jgi:type IV pilus assembly protein PilA